METVNLICGFLGAGKTTFAKKLANEFSDHGAVWLNVDNIAIASHTKKELENNWDGCFLQSYRACWEIIRNNPDLEFVLDAGFWSKKERDDARKMAKDLNRPCVLFYVCAPEETLKERVKLRNNPMSEQHIKEWDRIKTLFEPPTDEENPIIIDTSKK